MYNFLTDQIFTLGRFCLLLFKIDNVKQKKLIYWGHRTSNLSLTSFYLKLASRNKLLPVWGSQLGNTRACWTTWWGIHVSGKGVLSLSREKKIIKDFLFCLPILPAYLPFKFRNGQFPQKTPGPISPTTLEQNKKTKKIYTWGLHVGGKGVFLWTGKQFKDFQLCLPILPAYLPLKFPNGQFPLKIPGPISQAKLKPKKKKKLPPKKKKKIQN
jgi:hypothetical protein